MIVKLSHIGHAVSDMNVGRKIYADFFGLHVTKIVNLREQGNDGAMVPIGKNVIEIQAPTTPQGHIGRFLQQRGEGLYYVALVVDDMDKTIDSLRARKIEPLVFDASPNLPFKAVWVHPRATGGVLFELIKESQYKWIFKKEVSGKETQEKPVIARLSHFGHAVRNIDEALKVYSHVFDLQPVYQRTFPWGGVKNAMLPVGSNNLLELIEPTDSQGFVAKFLQKRGPGLYHISLIVDDMEATVKRLKSHEAEVLEFEPTSQFPYKAVWISPKSTRSVLFELLTEEMLDYLLHGKW